MPISRPPWTSASSDAGRDSIVSRSVSSAGRPASSSITLPSAEVIVSSGPMGVAPWETHGRTSTSSRRTPTAPSSRTSSPSISTALSPERPEARPPSTDTIGVDSDRKRSTASVGNVAGSASRMAPPAPVSSGIPVRAPAPSSSSSTAAWKAVAVPSPRCAAQMETAVPSSISRCGPITPPAPHPTSSRGSSASWMPSSSASGATRWLPDANTIARSQESSPSPSRAAAPASSAATRASPAVEIPVPIRTGIAPTILRAMPGPTTVVAIFGPTGIGKTAVAIALAERLRDEGEDPAAVSADALQRYDGLEILTGAPTAAERARLEHRMVGTLPLTAISSAGEYARAAHGEIDGLLAEGRRPIVVGGTGLYLRAALTDLDLRPPVPPSVRARRRAQLEAEGAPALHAELAVRAPATAAAIRPADGQRVTRALELLDAGQEPPPGAEGSRLWTAALRRPTLLAGLTMERGALVERIEARVDAMVAAGAEREVRAADAAGASPGARQALGFRALLDGDVEAMKTETRRYAKRQLTWMRKLPDVTTIDVTGREPADVAAELHGSLRAREAA